VLSSAVWYFRGRDVRTQGRPFLLKAANALILATLEVTCHVVCGFRAARL
jgi:hypothetical protein